MRRIVRNGPSFARHFDKIRPVAHWLSRADSPRPNPAFAFGGIAFGELSVPVGCTHEISTLWTDRGNVGRKETARVAYR